MCGRDDDPTQYDREASPPTAPVLRWGFGRYSPGPATIAGYGARLIWSEVMDGGSGVVWDRQDTFGDPRVLTQELLPVFARWLAGARKRWVMSDWGADDVLVLNEGRITVRGGPQQSHGYLYVTALCDRDDVPDWTLQP